MDFCHLHKRPPMPACEETLLELAAFLKAAGLHASSICGYFSAIRHLHIINGFPDPTLGCERLKLVKRGLAVGSTPKPLRAPITSRELLAFLSFLDLSVFDDALVLALCCLGFFGFMRVSEMLAPSQNPDPATSLTAADLTWSPGRLQVLLKTSKGDPSRSGVRLSLGLAEGVVCPLKATLGYLLHRARLVPAPDHARAPLFLATSGRPATKSWFASRLADLAKKAGVAGLVKPHSLRIGAATSAWHAGLSDSQIKCLGRWKSSAFLRYLRPSSEDLAALSSRIAR